MVQEEQRTVLQQYAHTIQERSMIVDKITLDQCSIPQELDTIVQTTQSQIQQYQQQQQSYQQTITHFQQNLEKIQEKIAQTTKHIQTIQEDITIVQTQIQSANVPDPSAIKQQITQHTQKQASIQSSLSLDSYHTINTQIELAVANQTYPIVYAHYVIQAAIQQGKVLAEELKNHQTAREYLEERYIQYRTERAQYELTEGTESYRQFQQHIDQQRIQIQQEKQILLTKKQSIEQQASDIQSQIDTLNARINTITKDNPDIKSCVDEIQQALVIDDADKIQQLQTIVSKYLGDKQIAQLTQELNILLQKKNAIHIQESLTTINT